MLGELFGAVLSRELRALRRRALGAELILAALLMLALAFGFFALGVFLWLSTLMPSWGAAFVAMIVPAVAALVLWLAARLTMPGRPRAEDDLAALARAFLSGEDAPRIDGRTVAALALAGLLIGLLSGGGPKK